MNIFPAQVLIRWQSMWLALTAGLTASLWTLHGGNCSAGRNDPPQVGCIARVSGYKARLCVWCSANLKGKEIGSEHGSGTDGWQEAISSNCKTAAACFSVANSPTSWYSSSSLSVYWLIFTLKTVTLKAFFYFLHICNIFSFTVYCQ